MGPLCSLRPAKGIVRKSYLHTAFCLWRICGVHHGFIIPTNSVCLCVRTCVCTSVSLKSMNQWFENRPAFSRVRDLLLLSQTTRRCGRRRTSYRTNTEVYLLIKI